MLLVVLGAGCRPVAGPRDEAVVAAIDRLDSPSIEEREEASALLERAPTSALPLLDEALAGASCHEVEYRILRAADTLLARDRVRIRPWMNRHLSKGGGGHLCLGFMFEVTPPTVEIHDFHVSVEEVLDEAGKPVPVESTVEIISLPNGLGGLEFRLDAAQEAPHSVVPASDRRIASVRGTLHFTGRTGEMSRPFRVSGLSLACR